MGGGFTAKVLPRLISLFDRHRSARAPAGRRRSRPLAKAPRADIRTLAGRASARRVPMNAPLHFSKQGCCQFSIFNFQFSIFNFQLPIVPICSNLFPFIPIPQFGPNLLFVGPSFQVWQIIDRIFSSSFSCPSFNPSTPNKTQRNSPTIHC